MGDKGSPPKESGGTRPDSGTPPRAALWVLGGRRPCRSPAVRRLKRSRPQGNLRTSLAASAWSGNRPQTGPEPCFLLPFHPSLSQHSRPWELSCAGQMGWLSLFKTAALERHPGGSVGWASDS